MSEFDGFTVGPNDYLVLLPRTPLSGEQAAELRRRIPGEIRGRVLVVEDFDAKVVRGA